MAQYSSLRALLFKAGSEGDVVASIDVSVAFLQATAYSADDMPRYVSLQAYPGAQKHCFRLLGPIYGQRSACRAWFLTLDSWLRCDMGYVRSADDVCVYRHPVTGHTMVTWVDDLLTRGSRESTDAFFRAMSDRFDCKDPTYLQEDSSITFTGWEVSLQRVSGVQTVALSQTKEMEQFQQSNGLWEEKLRASPMPERGPLLDRTPITAKEQKWCRSVIGELNHFSRSTRYDISHTVSRISGDMRDPVLGTVRAFRYLAGYLHSTVGLALSGRIGGGGEDQYEVYSDSDHCGDRHRSSRSHTGVLVLLNGVPVFWRSNKQTKTSLSPAEAEIYALSEAVRDSRSVAWVLEDMGVTVVWPIQVKTDSSGAQSFQQDELYSTKLKGCFSKREAWVKELRDVDSIITIKVMDKDNKADILTKCLKAQEFKRQLAQIINK